MGHYPVVVTGQYGAAYWDKYVAYSRTDLGVSLTKARVDVARTFCGSGSLVDIGIGCGQFVKTRGPATFGYDVNETAIRWLLDEGRWLDPWATDPENISCWDSLEHLARPHELISRVKSRVLVSLPIFKDKAHVLRSKHFRPDEHFWYWTETGFQNWMRKLGFAQEFKSDMETMLGREDIMTFVFRRDDV